MPHLHLESRHVTRGLNLDRIEILRSVLKLLITRLVAMNLLPLGEKVHRTHLLRRSPIVRVFGNTYDFKISGMLHIIAEVLADGVPVLEIFLLKEPVYDRDVACAGRILLVISAALDNLRPDAFEIPRACPQP